jgi:hypothetical protein
VFVVPEGEGDVAAFRAGLVELTALLELPWDQGDSVQAGVGKAPSEAAQGGTEAAPHV